VADGGGTAKALDYSIKRWPALMRFADSGVLPIDNLHTWPKRVTPPFGNALLSDQVRNN